MSASSTFEMEVADSLPPPPDRTGRIPAVAGESLLRALQRAGAPVLSICGGQASCGACRVEVEADWITRLTLPDKVEAALLEALDDPAPGHRLACQLILTPDLNGLRLTLAQSF